MLYRTRRRLPPVLGLVALAALSACGPVSDVREIPKSTIQTGISPRRFVSVDTQTRLGIDEDPHGHSPHGQSATAGPREQSSQLRFDYKIPDHWETLASSQLRLVNLRIPGGDGDPAECFLTMLPPMANGGDPELDYVQRWAKQMGQTMTADAVAKLDKVKLFQSDARFVELHGPYSGMGGPPKPDYTLLGIVLPAPGQILTLKMFGPKQLIARERAAFLEFASSLWPKASEPEPEQDDGPRGRLVWKLPAGWRQGQNRPMREATLHPNAGSKTECTLTFLSGTAGGRDLNIQRWCNQMGAKPPSPADIDKMPTLLMLGRTVTLAEIEGNYTGMSNEKVEKAVMFGVVCELPGRTLFVKMVGPASEMAAAREGFVALCRSLELEGGK